MRARALDLHPGFVAAAVGVGLADAAVTVHTLEGELVRTITRVATFAESFGIVVFPALAISVVVTWLARQTEIFSLGSRLRAFAIPSSVPPRVVLTVYVGVGAMALTQAAIATRTVVSHLKVPAAAPTAVTVTLIAAVCALLVADRIVGAIARRGTAFWVGPIGSAIERSSLFFCAVVALFGLREFLPNDGSPILAPIAVGTGLAVLSRTRWVRGLVARLPERGVALAVLMLLVASAAAYPALARLSGRGRMAVMYRAPIGSSLLALVRSVGKEEPLGTRSALAATTRRPGATAPVKSAPTSTVTDEGGPKPNLILLQLDTVRPDRVGFAGYARAHTPALDRFKEGATWFRSTYAPAPSTRYVIASLFTGVNVERVRADRPTAQLTLDVRTRTLAEDLEELGYDRMGVTIPYVLSQMDGYGRGFRVWESAWSSHGDYEPPNRGMDTASADAILARLKPETSDAKPFFLFGHFLCAHAPYLDAGNGESAAYDGALGQCDAQVGRVLDAIDARSDRDRTAVILFSDHGEMLGEHGFTGHGTVLYEPAIRSLLLARLPGTGGGVVDAPVSLTGVHAMLTTLAHGASSLPDTEHLLDLARGRATDDPHPIYVVTDEQVRLVRFRARAVIEGHHKYVRDATTGVELLFDLATDPNERRNLMQRESVISARLSRQLDTWLATE